jgi:hypothetical protein
VTGSREYVRATCEAGTLASRRLSGRRLAALAESTPVRTRDECGTRRVLELATLMAFDTTFDPAWRRDAACSAGETPAFRTLRVSASSREHGAVYAAGTGLRSLQPPAERRRLAALAESTRVRTRDDCGTRRVLELATLMAVDTAFDPAVAAGRRRSGRLRVSASSREHGTVTRPEQVFARCSRPRNAGVSPAERAASRRPRRIRRGRGRAMTVAQGEFSNLRRLWHSTRPSILRWRRDAACSAGETPAFR